MLSLIAIPRFQLRLKVWDFVNSFQDKSLGKGGGGKHDPCCLIATVVNPNINVFLAMTKTTQTLSSTEQPPTQLDPWKVFCF